MVVCFMKVFNSKEITACGIRNQLDVTWCYIYFLFISSSTCFRQPCAHPQELTTQWFYRRVWCSAVAAVGCQNWLAGCASIEEYVVHVLRTPQWIHNQLTGSDSLQQPRHYNTRGDKTTESSAPEDGHKVARNMLSYVLLRTPQVDTQATNRF